MKNTKITPTFVIVCIVIIVTAYGIGICINEIKASRIQAAENRILSKKIQDIEASSTNYENQEKAYSQNRNTRTGTTRREMQNIVGRQAMEMQGFDQQAMFNNFGLLNYQDIPGTQKTVEEPNNHVLQRD